MKSLELPSGSILIAPEQVPDNVYVLKRGLLGINDKLERLMAVIYKEEMFGFESLFGSKSLMYVKALSQVEVDMYEPEEFEENLREDFKPVILETMARRVWFARRRYPLKADDRMRDIIKELQDNGIPNGEITSIVLNLSVSDALAFERVKGEFGL